MEESRGRIFRRENKKLLAEFEAHVAQYRSNIAKALSLIGGAGVRPAAVAEFVSTREFIQPGDGADQTLRKLSASSKMVFLSLLCHSSSEQ